MKKFFNYHWKSFGYAFTGLRTLLLSEHNMLIHVIATIMIILMGWWRDLSPTKWCLLLLVIASVWITEAFNTALERLCDQVSKDFRPLIKQAKDISSAAVLIAVITAVVIGIIIFFF